ncbi:MAG: alpha/beta hydrolase family protein [Pyrinomonadaceae bacterium]
MNRNKNRFFLHILLLVFASSLQFSVYAQVVSETAVVGKPKGFQELKLDSKLMKREMPYRVILPVGYEVNAGEKFPVVYLLHGLTGHYNDWTDKTKIVEYAKNYDYIIVMPEGDNGWYSDSATIENDKYESYIMQELVPEIEKKFRANTNRESRAIAGLSMGGYGSLKFGLKYPEKFVLVGSFSGALRAAEWTAKEIGNSGWKVLVDSIMNTYGAADSDTRKQNDIFKLLQAKPADDAKKLPFFYLDCGTEDMLVLQARDFNLKLAEMKIPHEYRELPGIHNWNFWNAEVLEFLQVSERFIRSAKAKSN